jgi:VanZ family protein
MIRRIWPQALLVAVWLGFISWMSTDLFSSTRTSGLLVRAFGWLGLAPGDPRLDRANLLLRKGAHVAEYLVLSLLLLALVHGMAPRLRQWIRALPVLAAVAGFSCLDEFHQHFVPSRTASPWDCALDTAGGLLGVALVLVFSRLTRRPSLPKDG